MTVTTDEAAHRLGVSRRQVQRLVAAGELAAQRTAGEAWLVDATALSARASSRPRQGRPWQGSTAWAALWWLSDLEVPWLQPRTRVRLRERLQGIDVSAFVVACRRRATVHRYRASPSFLDAARRETVLSGAGATTVADFALAPDPGRVDGYCTDATHLDLVTALHLTPDVRGNVTLRVVDPPDMAVLDRAAMPVAVVALDLAESSDPRERAAGRRVLDGLLR